MGRQLQLGIGVLALLCGVFSAELSAGECLQTYVDGVTSHHSGGSITFGKNSVITGNPDSILASPTVDSSSQGYSCSSADCTSGGAAATSMNLGTFLTTSSSTDIIIGKNGSGNIGNSGTNEYDEVSVGQGALLTVSSGYSEYRIKNFTIGKNAVVNMPAGDYWIDNLSTTQGMGINLVGTGTIRLFINNSATLAKNVNVNAGGDPSGLFIYAYSDLTLGQGPTVRGYVYAQGTLTLGKNSLIEGAGSAKDVVFGQGAQLAYNSADIAATDFGNACTNGGGSAVDHYEIIHDAVGSNCAYESVTIKACTDAACSSLYSTAVSLDFQLDGSSESHLSFIGSTTYSYFHTTAQTLTLSVANPSVAASNALVCDDGSGSSCDMVFSSSGCSNASSCSFYFPDSLQGHSSSSKIKFKNTGKVISDDDSVLTFPTITDETTSSHNTCNTIDCTIAAAVAPALSLPTL